MAYTDGAQQMGVLSGALTDSANMAATAQQNKGASQMLALTQGMNTVKESWMQKRKEAAAMAGEDRADARLATANQYQMDKEDRLREDKEFAESDKLDVNTAAGQKFASDLSKDQSVIDKNKAQEELARIKAKADTKKPYKMTESDKLEIKQLGGDLTLVKNKIEAAESGETEVTAGVLASLRKQKSNLEQAQMMLTYPPTVRRQLISAYKKIAKANAENVDVQPAVDANKRINNTPTENLGVLEVGASQGELSAQASLKHIEGSYKAMTPSEAKTAMNTLNKAINAGELDRTTKTSNLMSALAKKFYK